MDEETRNLLKNWNLQSYLQVFEDNHITVGCLHLLDLVMIKELIPLTGDRIKFNQELQNWKTQAGKNTVASQTLDIKRGRENEVSPNLPNKLVDENMVKLRNAISSSNPDVNLIKELVAKIELNVGVDADNATAELKVKEASISVLVELLTSEDQKISEHAIRTIANLTDEAEQVTKVIEAGAIPVLTKLLKTPEVKIGKYAVRALANIAAGTTEQKNSVINAGVISILSKLLESPDVEISVWAAVALANIASGKFVHRKRIIQAGTIPVIVKLLESPLNIVCENAACILANIAYGTSRQKGYLIQAKVIPAMIKLLESPNVNVCEQACRVVANLTAGTNTQIDSVVASGAIPLLVQILNSSHKPELKLRDMKIDHEATPKITHDRLWELAILALGNIASGYTQQHKEKIVETGALPVLVKRLTSPTLEICENSISVIRDVITIIYKQKDQVVQGVIHALVNLLHSPHKKARIVAAEALVYMTINQVTLRYLVFNEVRHLTSVKDSLALGVLRQVVAAIRIFSIHIIQTQINDASLFKSVQILPVLEDLISLSDINILENTVWIFDNLIRGGNHHTQVMIRTRIVPKLVLVINHKGCVKVQKMVLRVIATIESLTDSQAKKAKRETQDNKHSSLPKEKVQQCLPMLKDFIDPIDENDENILEDVAWTISYLAGEDRNQLVIESGIVPTVVRLLIRNNEKVQLKAIRAVNVIACETDRMKQVIINCGVLWSLSDLLVHSRTEISVEAVRLVSTLSGGSQCQALALYDGGLLPVIVQKLSAADVSRRHAAVVLTNCTRSKELVAALLNCAVIAPLCSLLSSDDPELVELALESISRMITVEVEQVSGMLTECGGVSQITKLQATRNTSIAVSELTEHILKIVQKYPKTN